MNEIQYEKPPGTESPSTDQKTKVCVKRIQGRVSRVEPNLLQKLLLRDDALLNKQLQPSPNRCVGKAKVIK